MTEDRPVPRHKHEWGFWTGIHGQATTHEECAVCGAIRYPKIEPCPCRACKERKP